MASAVTSASASISANTDRSLKRKASPFQGDDDQPTPKRPKKQTKLDKLKDQLKVDAGKLKAQLVARQAALLDIEVAKNGADRLYTTLLATCKGILTGDVPDEDVLAFFREPFADFFQSEEVLRRKGMKPTLILAHKLDLSAITTLLANVARCIEAVLIEAGGLPPPSAYAHPLTWRVWQEENTAILNLRPPTKQGLPIEVLHPTFASFRHDVRSIKPDEWTPENKANSAGIALCRAMAFCFENEADRRIKVMEVLSELGLNIQSEYHIERTPPLEINSAQLGLCMSVGGMPVLLGEIKAEYETGDPYMQVSRSYQMLVHHLQGQNRAEDGVPCILLVVCGTFLTVAAGFCDGTDIIVEPLADPCAMMPSRFHHREKRLAHVLACTKKAVGALLQPSTIKLGPARTPKIYPTYVEDASEETHDLEFIELLGPSSLDDNHHLLFTAKSTAHPGRVLLVKLVDPQLYGEEAHRKLAGSGLAPELFGIARVNGAPSAVVMEYLDPSSGWDTLQNYVKKSKETGLVRLLEKMKEKKVVHGDLRPNNIMCRIRSEGRNKRQELEFKVVDFDWAGMQGSTKYPAIMNPQLPWPGHPYTLIGEDHDATLLEKTLG